MDPCFNLGYMASDFSNFVTYNIDNHIFVGAQFIGRTNIKHM